MRDRGEGLDVANVARRIADALAIHGARVVIDEGGDRLRTVVGREARRDPHLRQEMGEQRVRRPVELRHGDDVGAGRGHVERRVMHRRLAGAHAQALNPAFHGGDTPLEHLGCRIADARVPKAVDLQIEQRCRMLGALELVRRRLIDRDRGRWRGLVRRVAVMQRDRLLTHQMQSASRTERGQASMSRPCVAKSAIVSRSRPNAAQAVCATAPSSVRRPHVLPK